MKTGTMAWVNKGKKKKDWKKVHITDKTRAVKKIYNTQTWIKLRNGKLMNNPLCERCLAQGIIKSAEEVHHKNPISKGETDEEMRELAYNYDNLQSLCKKCHKEIHKEMGSGFLRS